MELLDELKQSLQHSFQIWQRQMDESKAAEAKAWIMKPFQPLVLLDALSKLILPSVKDPAECHHILSIKELSTICEISGDLITSSTAQVSYG